MTLTYSAPETIQTGIAPGQPVLDLNLDGVYAGCLFRTYRNAGGGGDGGDVPTASEGRPPARAEVRDIGGTIEGGDMERRKFLLSLTLASIHTVGSVCMLTVHFRTHLLHNQKGNNI
jgi:hypothetical protein